jgi:glyoxylase-like metal-dependent hydrolase (beta-lactamase superfamily II)
VKAWDEHALSYGPTGQRCARFVPDARIEPGQTLTVGGRRWQAHAAPGHDPHSLIFFEAEQRVVISADALWERGFGVVFPELGGEPGFDAVARTLDLIESFDARCAIPGHGAPFFDLAGALQRARLRLAGFRADPARHARHAVKALIKYHLLEEQQQSWPQLMAWFTGVSLYETVWHSLGRPAGSMAAFAQQLVEELATAGVLRVADGQVFNT